MSRWLNIFFPFSFRSFPRYNRSRESYRSRESSLSRPADNYVPRGETRWIGEIDRRDRCRLEALVLVEGIEGNRVVRARSNMNERSDLSIVIETTTPPRPRRSKRGKTGMISSGEGFRSRKITRPAKRGEVVFRSTSFVK